MLEQEHKTQEETLVSGLAPNKGKKLASAIRFSAMNLLARREHSWHELSMKLEKRYPDKTEIIEEELSRLNQQGLQSDQRFCEAYIRSSIAKYHGPKRLQQNLKLKGVSEELIDQALHNAEVDWFELAKALQIKKYGGQLASDVKEKAKQQRFLQYRGFSFEQIRYAMKL